MLRPFIYKSSAVLITILSVPLVAKGQVTKNIKELSAVISGVLQNIIAILIGAAVLVFLWSIIKYLMKGKNESDRQDAKKYMIYGIIAIFIMVSVWGLIGLLNQTTEIQQFIGLPEKK